MDIVILWNGFLGRLSGFLQRSTRITAAAFPLSWPIQAPFWRGRRSNWPRPSPLSPRRSYAGCWHDRRVLSDKMTGVGAPDGHGLVTPLSASGRYIVDAHGRRVRLAGVHWDGAHEDDG